jgi:hypothetical protein
MSEKSRARSALYHDVTRDAKRADEVAHQRKIAEVARNASGTKRLTSLDGCYVKLVERDQAEPIILKFEWLGDIGHAHKFVGLFTADGELGELGELLGVACFGHGPAPADMRTLLGGAALCLERGACVPHAPPNAASFLISRACKLIASEMKVYLFFAYGDPEAGEYGAVYQAANWIYLGQGLMGRDFITGKLKRRSERWKVLAPGGNPEEQREWKASRDIRRLGPNFGPLGIYNLKIAEAKELGWTFKKFPAKHVYAINVGADARQWRKRMTQEIGLPYPAPRAELKRNN